MGTQLPSQKGGRAPSIFGPFLLWRNGWMHQDATWYGAASPPDKVIWAKAYQQSKLHLCPSGPSSRLVTTERAKNLGGLCPLFVEGAGSPSNTMSSGPRPTSVPSAILIHPAIWPQQTWAEKLGDSASFLGSWLGPHLTQNSQG